ncbi:MAG: T9SS type A sorting domain-containing protein [candidate division WOR-3 bacterium]|nr:T9SS type A sorting domain-containing protein [candidate division WOR-3 bacterium]
MLDYPDQTALVEYHSATGDFGFLQKARDRVYNYYIFYGYPSLFADGVDLWPISTWRPWLTSRMAQPSPVTLNITGGYDPVTNNGTVTASFQNDSASAITARVYFVITEDSLYHLDPNGHGWHNKLARDFLPDEIGEVVTIDPGQTVDVNRPFMIDAAWDETRCNIVTWIQVDAPSREGLQAGKIKIMDLVGIEEIVLEKLDKSVVTLVNNPCSADNIRFLIELPQGAAYEFEIFDVLGRNVKSLTGITSSNREILHLDLNAANQNQVSAGVYLYRFVSQSEIATGKIIVK